MKKYLLIIVFALIFLGSYLLLSAFCPNNEGLFFWTLFGGFVGFNVYAYRK